MCCVLQANRLYHPAARWLAVLVVDLPVIVAGTCAFIFVSSSMIHPNGDMINYYLLVSLASAIGFSYANLCVEVSRTLHTAILLFGMSAALAIWFSGYSISTEALMDWIQWTPKCSYLYWVTGTLMFEEFSFLPEKQRDFILGKYKYDNMSLWESYRNLLITFAVLQALLLCLVLRQPESKARHEKTSEQKSIESERSESMSTPLMHQENSFQLTREEESMVIEFFGPPRESTSLVEIYACPPMAEHIVPERERVTLACRRFSCSVMQGRVCMRKETKLLSAVNFVVRPGELCAVMGPIGAGDQSSLCPIRL